VTSLVDVGNWRPGFVGSEGRSLFDVGIGDRALWVMRCDRCLVWGKGDRVCGW
jgi:hypothetical protein